MGTALPNSWLPGGSWPLGSSLLFGLIHALNTVDYFQGQWDFGWWYGLQNLFVGLWPPPQRELLFGFEQMSVRMNTIGNHSTKVVIPMIHDRISVDPKIMFGKPVIKGTRIPVELILRKIAEGMTDREILTHHPHLGLDDIRAAVAFAADHLANEEIVLASGSLW
jgi:uncharacterized protein (DUF433 family)